ncbi:MAG: hypothetical protein NVS9B11_12540 [Candidatus Dormibacteraceae bacterium]
MTRDDDAFHLLLFMLDPTSYGKSASVTDKPQVQLTDWDIKEDTAGNRYFVGSEVGGRGRASTAIVEFDAERMRGRTESGRVYELLGPPGRSSNGEYTWSIYKVVNGITEVDRSPSADEGEPS